MRKTTPFLKKMPELPVLILGWVGFLLWLLSPMAQAVELPSVWETMDKQAYDEYQKGHIEAAEDLFEDPVWHGVTLYKLGRYQEAINEFQRVKTALSRYNLGNSYAQLGQFAKAKQAYNRALKLHPSAELKTKIEHNLKLMEKLLTPKKQATHPKQSPNQSKQSKPSKQPQTPQKSPSNQKQGAGQSSASNNKDQNSKHQQGKEGKKTEGKQTDQPNSTQSAGKTPSKTGQHREKNQGIQTQDTDKTFSSKDSQQTQEPIKLGKKSHQQGLNVQEKGTESKPLSEQQQAQQTWLNQIPDEPERFIQRKFKYQYQQQSQHSSEPKKIW